MPIFMPVLATITVKNKNYTIDLTKAIDLSISIQHGKNNPNCFWAPYPWFEAYQAGGFIGSTLKGAPVNFFNIKLNPHGSCTHTECVGHIAKETYTINNCLKTNWFKALLITVEFEALNGDKIITESTVNTKIKDLEEDTSALIVRTLPNTKDKLTRLYSGTNPPYLQVDAMDLIVKKGIQHFLIDLPSIDREEDAGELLSHHRFWQYPSYKSTYTEKELEQVRQFCTISELLYINNEVKDGYYFLNLQTLNINLDVSPSKPLIYPILNF